MMYKKFLIVYAIVYYCEFLFAAKIYYLYNQTIHIHSWSLSDKLKEMLSQTAPLYYGNIIPLFVIMCNNIRIFCQILENTLSNTNNPNTNAPAYTSEGVCQTM